MRQFYAANGSQYSKLLKLKAAPGGGDLSAMDDRVAAVLDEAA